MAPPSQNRVVAQAAREVLEPAGLVGRGRSRVWLDDHAWWLVAVEFQPALWDRGTFVNVGAMWLWHDTKDYVYFDLGERLRDAASSDDETGDQFLSDVRAVAARALEEVERLRGLILGFEDVARQLREEPDRSGGWPAWDCAVAYGLAGDSARAAEMFGRIAADD